MKVYSDIRAHAEHVVENLMTATQIDIPREHGIFDIAVDNVIHGILSWQKGEWVPHEAIPALHVRGDPLPKRKR
jgi:hypothetical protein